MLPCVFHPGREGRKGGKRSEGHDEEKDGVPGLRLAPAVPPVVAAPVVAADFSGGLVLYVRANKKARASDCIVVSQFLFNRNAMD